MNLRDLQRIIPEQWKIQSKSRDGKKATLVAYIDARDVMKLLDEVVGPEYWKDEYQALDAAGRSVKCKLSLKMKQDEASQEEWVSKEDIGTASDYEGEKGAFSDAFKRAAVKWGVGRFLYDLDILTINLDQYGNLVDEYGKRITDITEYGRTKMKEKQRQESPEQKMLPQAPSVPVAPAKKIEDAFIRQQHGVICDKCGHLMKERTSAHGAFLGCSNYPNCRNTKPLTAILPKEPALTKLGKSSKTAIK